jgi:hypothetical protein
MPRRASDPQPRPARIGAYNRPRISRDVSFNGELDNDSDTGAESWQFPVFAFAAVATLVLSVLDEVPKRPLPIVAEVMMFFGLG